MDGTQEEVSTAIFDVTHACLQSFDQIVADYDDSLLEYRLGSSDDTTIGSNRERSAYDFLGLRAYFLSWIDNTGALSLMSASLDAKLRGLEEISSMVVDFLGSILRNLRHCQFSHCQSHLRTANLPSGVNSSVSREPEEAEVPSIVPQRPTKLHIHLKTWEDASQAIETALRNLHFIARLIRETSAEQLGLLFPRYFIAEDIVFRRDIASWVRYKFPAARSALCQQLGDSIWIRRRLLEQTACHATELAARRVSAKVPTDKQHDSQHPNPPAETKQKVDNGVAHTPSVLATGVTKASGPDPHSPSPPILHRPKQRALTTVISIISTSQEDIFKYPPMPKGSGDETWMQCPICFIRLERKELTARDDHWKHHIDEHVKPYGCPFPGCATSQPFFAHRDQWKTHMESAHSKDWLRKLHTIVWICDIDHDAPKIFETELQWREHMQNLDSHPTRIRKVPTEAQLCALRPQKVKVALRDEFVCPLCEQIPEELRLLVEMGQGDPAEMYAFLVDHVADHLKSLSLMALPFSDTTVPETFEPNMHPKGRALKLTAIP